MVLGINGVFIIFGKRVIFVLFYECSNSKLYGFVLFYFVGTVAPDAIHHHVKSCRDNIKNLHFVAPEYGGKFILVNFLEF